MNENVLTDITRKFLVELVDEYDIDFDEIMDSIEWNF